jgi:hypothetical protein
MRLAESGESSSDLSDQDEDDDEDKMSVEEEYPEVPPNSHKRQSKSKIPEKPIKKIKKNSI